VSIGALDNKSLNFWKVTSSARKFDRFRASYYLILTTCSKYGIMQHNRNPTERFRGDSDTLMAARSQPNDNWGSVGNGAKHGEKARRWWFRYVMITMWMFDV